ncbi:MAG: hypothetical protein IIW93_05515 [Bacteroidaceae bacterium]|nr:hypothetical protein [Bacteroidaceae bacterium]
MKLIEVMKKYREDHSSSNIFEIFKDYELDNRLDKNALNVFILDELGAMDVWYEDPEVYKVFSDNFFEIWKDNIKKLTDTVMAEYNLLQNTNMTETTTVEIDQDMDTTTSGSKTDSYTRSTTDGDEETNKVSAFDETTFQNDSQRISSGTGSVSHNGSKTDSGTKNEDLEWRETDVTTRVGYKDKDIQGALEKERKLNRFNVYQWIIKKYKEDMMVLVY